MKKTNFVMVTLCRNIIRWPIYTFPSSFAFVIFALLPIILPIHSSVRNLLRFQFDYFQHPKVLDEPVNKIIDSEL
jgi:hypothetical protein